MEAPFLMCDVIGIAIVLLWVARGRGTAGLFGWRPDPPAKPARRRD